MSPEKEFNGPNGWYVGVLNQQSGEFSPFQWTGGDEPDDCAILGCQRTLSRNTDGNLVVKSRYRSDGIWGMETPSRPHHKLYEIR